MAEERDQPKDEQKKSMIETIMTVQGAKVLGPPGDKKKAADRIMASYEDAPSFRNEKIMKDFEDTVNKPAKSIGERIEER